MGYPKVPIIWTLSFFWLSLTKKWTNCCCGLMWMLNKAIFLMPMGVKKREDRKRKRFEEEFSFHLINFSLPTLSSPSWDEFLFSLLPLLSPLLSLSKQDKVFRYSKRSLSTANLHLLPVRLLQYLLCGILGDGERGRVLGIISKKELIASIEASLLTESEMNLVKLKVREWERKEIAILKVTVIEVVPWS